MFKFFVKVFSVMGKALSGELSCMGTGLVFEGRLSEPSLTLKPFYIFRLAALAKAANQNI